MAGALTSPGPQPSGGAAHLRYAGHAAGLPLQGALLTHGEQAAGEDGAEVVEGPPAHAFQLLRDAGCVRGRSGEEPGQERLL